jgi:hypothetical protein
MLPADRLLALLAEDEAGEFLHDGVQLLARSRSP